MGVWVEMLDKKKVVNGLANLELPFVDDVGRKLRTDPHLFSGYWRAMANGVKGSNVANASPVMEPLEKLGVILVLPAVNNENEPATHRFLSPVVIANSELSCAHEHNIISRAISALKPADWTLQTKGTALEEIVEASLVLHAKYVNDPTEKSVGPPLTLEALIKRLGGQLHIRVPSTTVVDESLLAVFSRDALNEVHVTPIEAFPSVFYKDDAQTSSTEQDARFKKNIEVLETPGVAVLSPTFSNNEGCDRIMVCRIEDTNDVALLIFETKQYFTARTARATTTTKSSIKKKAMDTLEPHLKCVQHFNGTKSIKIRRVCFVHCNAPALRKKRENPFDVAVNQNTFIPTKSKEAQLHKITQALAAAGCTTSLHTVWSEEEWLNLLDCLYFVVPDIGDEPLHVSAAIKAKKRVVRSKHTKRRSSVRRGLEYLK
ncbi:Hypothetical protein, putative [Bodo saltans]|uniref:Uncharacterized protein n=1 Tax=Bodo saltans TaxID=75058 RepID=A0A0S4IM39_BODSA|nr:Hypothetical protein, putative [Bodo saltans]|eukprot:CUF37401.1 Hypothetical protein, putative [Bodo saltans]